MTRILSIHTGHDSTAAIFDEYELLAAVQQERLTRIKNDSSFPTEAIDEVLRIAGLTRADVDQIVLSRGYYPTHWLRFNKVTQLRYGLRKRDGRALTKNMFKEMTARGITDEFAFWRNDKFLADEGFKLGTPVHFTDHHNCHALSAFFYAPPWESALLYTSDGVGDDVFYSARIFKDGELTCLFGDRPQSDGPASLGLAYSFCTEICGFRMNRHEGKLTGLAAYGQPDLADAMGALFSVAEDGRIDVTVSEGKQMRAALDKICAGASRETIAASIQHVLEDVKTTAISRIIADHGVRNLALAGGVFANVRLNALLAALPGVDEVFICPAMGDEGLPVGGALEFLMQRDGLETWLKQRRQRDDVYLGGAYPEADAVFSQHPDVTQFDGDPAQRSADLMANGKVGAIFTGRMEYGPRALGARSIIASPTDPSVNQTINERLQRTEFMPFAPCVLEEDAEAVFGIDDTNRYACRFMTITTPVHDAWREKIPAVVHVDGTARPQIIKRDCNPLYAEILDAFKARSGLPAMINTSFNAHEEPIINTPAEALQALLNNRVDFLVTENGVYSATGPLEGSF